jgi:hypothetical protein
MQGKEKFVFLVLMLISLCEPGLIKSSVFLVIKIVKKFYWIARVPTKNFTWKVSLGKNNCHVRFEHQSCQIWNIYREFDCLIELNFELPHSLSINHFTN